ncbi:metal-dependent transcriptional regulator [Dinghuibacter silviterrae]|uniref:Transcriptional regulator MntR n=1 Tax=Dinghuibacter silviterrae TaxID=1539049 RepID=A0A4R8DFB2_9BACT|nr:metal-dependent transcriptional regulator [Dinghuibacter silviterrae]TDW96283.1 DtxR family iron (metal) dependent repressor [Dinghuibacter silviterrae]
MTLSKAEEDYLKSIFRLQQETGQVNTNAVAQDLRTKPASVTDMLKKLKQKKLLHYEPYQEFKLSAEGRKTALGIVRRHRLWEYFLVEKLGMGWNEVHDIAEQLEHVSDQRLIERLDTYLGFPDTDPHGDPIPDAQGRMKVQPKISLALLPLNMPAEVCSVGNQSSEMLEMLEHLHIRLGTRLEVKRRFDFDGSAEVKIRNKPLFVISRTMAQNLFVVYDQ